jgi:CRP-like cAMP-binding protein
MFSLSEAPPTSNRILQALTRPEYEFLAMYLEPVRLWTGEVLYHPEQSITHVYFPNRGTVSVIAVFADGGSVEAGMVGNEGMFGINVFLGSISTPLQAVVQLPGDGGILQDVLLRYTQAFITQVAQTAACNNSHKVEGRLARWLLMCGDRAHSAELDLTQEFISQMLGIRRAGVSVAAGELQERGIIRYRRGCITIVDRAALEAESCECYEVVKKEFKRLL